MLVRFEYLSTLFYLIDDFVEAQSEFSFLLFFRRRPKVVYYYSPMKETCFSWYRRGKKMWYLCTPYKELTKKGLIDFLTTAMKIFRPNEDHGEFIEQIINDLIHKISTHSNGIDGEIMPLNRPIMPSNQSISSEVCPIAPTTTYSEGD